MESYKEKNEAYNRYLKFKKNWALCTRIFHKHSYHCYDKNGFDFFFEVIFCRL